MSAYPEDEGSPTPLDAEEVFDLVGGSLGHLRMSRSLEQITTRGYSHHRRRAAVTALAGVAAITALGAAVAFAQSGGAGRAVSTADGSTTVGVAGSGSVAPRMTDPDWTVTASPGGGYAVDITALGDVTELNMTLDALGVELKVVETAPSASQSGCPSEGGASPTTSVPATDDSTSASAPATASTSSTLSTAMTSPDAPPPTPVSFAVSGTAAEFTFGELPKESAFSFISTDGRGRPLLGTVRISDACLPVFGG